LTQERLGWDVGMTAKGYLSRIESGQRMPSVDLLERIAQRLGGEVRDLFIFPELGPVDEAMDKLRREAGPKKAKPRR
jgi:transcriptional regulator with XRE-family HTH domain